MFTRQVTSLSEIEIEALLFISVFAEPVFSAKIGGRESKNSESSFVSLPPDRFVLYALRILGSNEFRRIQHIGNPRASFCTGRPA